MKSNNTNNAVGRKAVGLSGANLSKNSAGNVKPTGNLRGKGRKKNMDDDKFADLNMRLGADEEQDISASWTGSAARRRNYLDEDESESYEGSGYGRGRMSYDNDDELNNDPYETFRRG